MEFDVTEQPLQTSPPILSKLSRTEKFMYPNSIIVGATKAGTTSLFRYLADHPDVCVSSEKEINFFFRYRNNVNEQTLKKYESFFGHCPSSSKVQLEASPVYLSGGKWIAEQIQQIMPDSKIVFILREPVGRYVSHIKFWMAKTRNIPEGFGISEAIAQGLSEEFVLGEREKDTTWEQRATQLVRAGCYARSLAGYLEVIPPEQISVVFFEDLAKRPKEFTQSVCEFLGIDGSLYDDYPFTIENKTRIVKFKGLHQFTIGVNNKLQPILNRIPALRKAIRSMYFMLNRETKNNRIEFSKEELAPLADFYNKENKDLKALLSQTYPDLALPDWLKAAG